MKPEYIDWLIEEKTITTKEGKSVTVLELVIQNDERVLDAWAKHLREHYCADSEIDILRVGFGYDRCEYLEKIKFPDAKEAPGPSVRSGDFTEILIADYVQFVLDYIVPRTRYDRKVNPNSSPMGSDLVGYRCGQHISQSDELIVFEVKATAREVLPPRQSRLQKSIDDSNKDVLRLAETLNAIFQRLVDRHEYEQAKIIQRFQNPTDTPYKRVFAAAAIHSSTSFSEADIQAVSTLHHTNPDLILLVIRCNNLMQFIHGMYRRACKC